ncbi:hypothetical protein MP228_002340 [Amoeboaphelidium protococcarum]|nr:hypothetical protein MP228_002340 [Amoeboaphelidium protococcarum]
MLGPEMDGKQQEQHIAGDQGSNGGGGGGGSDTDLVKKTAGMKVKEVLDVYSAGKDMSQYRFWSTQPVMRFDQQEFAECGPIEPDVVIENVRKTPYALPPGYLWETVDLQVDDQLEEVAQFLDANYVEDLMSTFRLCYSNELLRFALCPPGYLKDWHVCLRDSKGKLLATIFAVPATMSIYGKSVKMVIINFLCVHKILRSKRLAPVLIKEITRRVNLTGLSQAAYTAGTTLPRAVSNVQYLHRSINVKKLVDTGFSYIKKKMTLMRTIKLFKLPTQYTVPGFRVLSAEDKDLDAVLTQCATLYMEFYKQFDMYHDMSLEEVKHYLTPVNDSLVSCVVQNAEGKVLAFTSYYIIKNKILGNPKYDYLNSAFQWQFAVAKDSGVTLQHLFESQMIHGANTGMDVFTCLKGMGRDEVLEKLKFAPGDGHLNFYLFNYKCPQISADKQAFMII